MIISALMSKVICNEKSINNLLIRARELKLVYGEYNFKTEFYLCGNDLQVKMKDIGQYI